jgi:hypothetical protein
MVTMTMGNYDCYCSVARFLIFGTRSRRWLRDRRQRQRKKNLKINKLKNNNYNGNKKSGVIKVSMTIIVVTLKK